MKNYARKAIGSLKNFIRKFSVKSSIIFNIFLKHLKIICIQMCMFMALRPLIQRILFTTFHFLISAFCFYLPFSLQLNIFRGPRNFPILRVFFSPPFVYLFVSLFAVLGIYL